MIAPRPARPAAPIATVLGPLRIRPPAESTSELNHTVRPSYWASLHLDVVRLALLGQRDRRRRSSASQVSGGVGHQVLAVPEQLGVGVDRGARRAGPSRSPSRSARPARRWSPASLLAPVHGWIQPASANSAVQSTSIADDVDRAVLGGEAAHELRALRVGVVRQRVELDGVLAARGRGARFAAAANEPDGSGKTYQLHRGRAAARAAAARDQCAGGEHGCHQGGPSPSPRCSSISTGDDLHNGLCVPARRGRKPSSTNVQADPAAVRWDHSRVRRRRPPGPRSRCAALGARAAGARRG